MSEISGRQRIDRNTAIPLYIQVRGELEAQIRAGDLAPGDRLPTDRELTERFRVSRATIRQAFDALERDRLIFRERGRGAFVAELATPQWHLESTGGLSDEREVEFTSEVVAASIETLPDHAAAVLGLELGSTGVILERVRSFSNRVFMHVTNYLHAGVADVVLSSDLRTELLYEVMARKLGITIAGAKRTIISVAAAEPIASLLKVRLGSPLLLVESVSWNPRSEPVDYYIAYVRTEAIKIQVMTTGGDARASSFTTAENDHDLLDLASLPR